jgi:hypothetical protein
MPQLKTSSAGYHIQDYRSRVRIAAYLVTDFAPGACADQGR